jgi:flagellar protein FlaI
LKLFPLLHDNYIEEIFLDAPNNFIYLNHKKFGRCVTDIRFLKSDIERVKTLIRLYSGKKIDFKNPSIKYVIKNKFFSCRFSIDVKPIHKPNFALTIRKFNNEIFTIQELIKNRTINATIASFLFFCLIHRINITVIGETDSGKTTLVNALDLMTPKHFRKIYVENITESLDQTKYGKHQLKYSVDSLTVSNNLKNTKSHQIRRLLHRTPDLIYLGEILTKEEAEAMFHCLSAGLTGFQTIHAKDMRSFINRILYHFKINKACLEDLGIIILMKKNSNSDRKIVSISEISSNKSTNKQILKEIFSYNPRLEKWTLKLDLYKTETLHNVKRYEKLNYFRFWETLKYFYNVFEDLVKTEMIPVERIVNIFHQLSNKVLGSKYLINKEFESLKKTDI